MENLSNLTINEVRTLINLSPPKYVAGEPTFDQSALFKRRKVIVKCWSDTARSWNVPPQPGEVLLSLLLQGSDDRLQTLISPLYGRLSQLQDGWQTLDSDLRQRFVGILRRIENEVGDDVYAWDSEISVVPNRWDLQGGLYKIDPVYFSRIRIGIEKNLLNQVCNGDIGIDGSFVGPDGEKIYRIASIGMRFREFRAIGFR